MTSFEASFSAWLKAKASDLDDACGAAMQDGLVGLSGSELDAANKSLSTLYADTSSGTVLRGGDCDYSLKGMGPLYTGHWHGKRTHDGLSVILPLRSLLSGQPTNVVDIGAGTDAALWAWTLIACFADANRSPYPVHTWTSIDSSRDMIAQSNRLWASMCAVLPDAARVVNRQSALLGDWRKPPSLPANAIVVGSYLFSKTDADDSRRTAPAFAAFLKGIHAAAIVLWTTKNKRGVLDRIRTELIWWKNHTPQTLFDCPLQGTMH